MLSLYDLTVPNYQRVVDATVAVMHKGLAFFTENDVKLADIVSMRLADDMLPFSSQVNFTYHQAVNGVTGLLNGEFRPPGPLHELDYQGLISHLESAAKKLAEFTPEQINAVSCKPVYFKIPDRSIPFTAENFSTSFVMPNLYFHATTIYDMLRIKGVPLGKRDFLGQMQIGLEG